MGTQQESLTPQEIGQMLNDQAEALARTLLPGGFVSGGFYNAGDVHGTKGDSLKINLRNRKGAWADYACARNDPEGTGDMLKLVYITVGERDWGKTLRWARGWLGIENIDPHALERHKRRAALMQQRAEAARAGEIERSQKHARNLWMHASPLIGTPALKYLEGRGIDFSRIGRLPGACRFRADMWHADLRRSLPALLTAGIRNGEHVATHCIYLHRDEQGQWVKLPDIVGEDGKRHKAAKKVFGQDYYGAHFPINKGTSRKPLPQCPPREAVYCSEGLEDALTYAMVRPDARVVMAAVLGAIGAMIVPPQAGDFIILAQRDPDGSKAQKSFETQLKAQQERAQRDGSGRAVSCVWPAEGFKDLNDELRGVRMGQ